MPDVVAMLSGNTLAHLPSRLDLIDCAAMTDSIHVAAFSALMLASPEQKCAEVARLHTAWEEGAYRMYSGGNDPLPIIHPGRPKRPERVPPQALRSRKVTTADGHAALIHAIAHIEFNAINLALDCVYRYRAFPPAFHAAWLKVAAEEALHFELLCGRLQALGAGYGDFPAHNGLWDMACRTAHDPLARMALVPRVLEARGLDATPPIIEKLRRIGDRESIAVLERILADEVSHVALGDYWFKVICMQRDLEPESTYLALIDSFSVARPHPPVNETARLEAGFSAAEIEWMVGRR